MKKGLLQKHSKNFFSMNKKGQVAESVGPRRLGKFILIIAILISLILAIIGILTKLLGVQ